MLSSSMWSSQGGRGRQRGAADARPAPGPPGRERRGALAEALRDARRDVADDPFRQATGWSFITLGAWRPMTAPALRRGNPTSRQSERSAEAGREARGNTATPFAVIDISLTYRDRSTSSI